MGSRKGLNGVGEAENDDTSLDQCSPQMNDHCLMYTKYLLEDKSWPQKYSAVIENAFRKVARQEANDAVQRFTLSNPRSFPSQIDPSGSRPFKLQFEANIPCKLFTENKVEAEGPSVVKLHLLDAVSGDPITDGPLSSEKVEIVVLQGHFNVEQHKEWTKKDFCTHMVYQRYNKGSLLVGQCVIALCNGVGFVDNIRFTDNSSWGRSKKFRLGARVLAEEDLVREAVSNAFQVKDRRGETYQKHDVLSLEDEVWRLRWIAKNGKICKKLEENQIYKVKDFITFYHNNESLLRHIMKVSTKKWKEIIEHAKSCLKGNDACTNLNNSAQIYIPIGNAINPITIPCSNLHQFRANESYAGESHQEHQLRDHSMGLENFMLENLVIGSSEDVCFSSLCYSMPLHSNTMLNGETSNWLTDHLTRREDIGLLSCIPSASVDASEIANPKAGLEDIG